jgi:hypothetical protein
MEMNTVYITGRYTAQVDLIKDQVLRNPEFLWEVTENPKNASVIFFFDCIQHELLSFSATKILVRQEPRMVIPFNYDPKNLAKFDLIVNVGKSIDGIEKNINWPQKIDLRISSQFAKSQSSAVLINSNLLSLASDEMYSLRRILAYKSNDIDLYGYGWNKGMKPSMKALLIEVRKYIRNPLSIKVKGLKYYFRYQENYKGSVDNKIHTMENYRMAIVIENSLDYVSEKIFDSFSAGCIPIYVGPDLNEYEIPRSLYIQAEPSESGVKEAIEKAKKVDYAKWFGELESWFNSEAVFESWSEETFLSRLKEVITNSNHFRPYSH